MRGKWSKDILCLASRRNIPHTNSLIIALVFVLVVVFVMYILYSSYKRASYERDCRARILVLKVNLKTMRTAIEIYHKENDQYPASINEIRPYIASDKMYVDLTSDKQIDIPEYRKLNDKGGYYYDPNTGEIRFNLTRPVQEYLKWYSGEYKDQIPSSW